MESTKVDHNVSGRRTHHRGIPHGAAARLLGSGKITAHSWNVFRYLGDYLHLFGVIILLATIIAKKSVKGFSRSTQILYCMVFVTRYLDLLHHSQSFYLVFFKLTYIITSVSVLFLFVKRDQTYERRIDSVSLAAIIVPCAVASVLLTREYSVLELCWTFSEFIEAFALVPQYVFCYREAKGGGSATPYVICLGGYRVLYALNWIYKKVQMPQYSDIPSWIGGVVEILFFIDFLSYRFTGNSMLRSLVLMVDSVVNDISDKVERKVLGTTREERISKIEGEGGAMRRRKRGEEDVMADV